MTDANGKIYPDSEVVTRRIGIRADNPCVTLSQVLALAKHTMDRRIAVLKVVVTNKIAMEVAMAFHSYDYFFIGPTVIEQFPSNSYIEVDFR